MGINVLEGIHAQIFPGISNQGNRFDVIWGRTLRSKCLLQVLVCLMEMEDAQLNGKNAQSIGGEVDISTDTTVKTIKSGK